MKAGSLGDLSMFRIESFTREHASELEELQKMCEIELGWDPPKEYLEEWVKAVLGIHHQDPNLTKIAVKDGKIVGYCISVKRLHDYEGVVMDVAWNSGYIWDLFVLKECRRMGIGTTLLNDATAYFKSIGVDKVGLLVNHRNENAKKLFEKLGFKLFNYYLIRRL
jgi:ribosomal protein S18 acetylase RimI-like enzyme